jgi:putative ABC transport system permease protein
MEQMLIVNGPSVLDRSVARQRLLTLKNEIKTLPGVESVTTSGAIPGGGYNWGTYIRRDGSQEDERRNGNIVWVDPDFISTYNITVLAGRSFDIANKSDMEGVLVNEAALSAYGLGSSENALSERLILGGDTTNIVGVLKNYHWNSLKLDHTPWLFKADTISGKAYSILLTGGQFSETIKQIETKYKEAFPGNPFDYYFLDDFFNAQYKDHQQFGKVFGMFAALAIMIACLGLWGLAAYSTNQKLKEIGIRKVMGATVPGIMYLLSWQFVKLVGIASLIGLPIAWFGISKWLSSFPFRTDMQWYLFVIPVFALLMIALLTVSIQIFRGANANPAKILRSE